MYLKIQTFYWQSSVLESIKEDKTLAIHVLTCIHEAISLDTKFINIL